MPVKSCLERTGRAALCPCVKMCVHACICVWCVCWQSNSHLVQIHCVCVSMCLSSGICWSSAIFTLHEYGRHSINAPCQRVSPN